MVFDYELMLSLIFAVVQGITEWLPVSSSGHLVLFETLLNYHPGLIFDVALHFGTLMAVFVYFGGDIIEIIKEVIKGNWSSENGRLGIMLIIASIPAAIVGFLFKSILRDSFSNIFIVALGFGVTGMFLLVASLKRRATAVNHKMNYKDSFVIGCAQALALIPGVSRSGATLSSGLFRGLNEKQAVKFSFLMSIPVVFGANILVIGNTKLPPNLIWATLVSFVIGLITLHVLVKYLLSSRENLKWFGLYALVLAAVLITLLSLGFL